jgi:hypothetical protein
MGKVWGLQISNNCIFTPIENWTGLCELTYSEYSILPIPKIFTIPPETPYIYSLWDPTS